MQREKGKNLLDVLDDETIAYKIGLDLEIDYIILINNSSASKPLKSFNNNDN